MTRREQAAVVAVIRRLIKIRGMKYAELAKHLAVSEPTVKRFFGKSASWSLDRLASICEALGVSFFEVMAMAQGEDDLNYFLKPEQEAYFAKHPALFGIFRALYFGEKPQSVARKWRLSAKDFYRSLRVLEKLGMLEVQAGDRIVFRLRGVVRWSHAGPMTARLVPEQNAAFFKYVYSSMAAETTCFLTTEGEMTEHTFREMSSELQDLGRRYRAKALRETQLLPKESLRSVRWVAALAPFQTDWTRYQLRH